MGVKVLVCVCVSVDYRRGPNSHSVGSSVCTAVWMNGEYYAMRDPRQFAR